MAISGSLHKFSRILVLGNIDQMLTVDLFAIVECIDWCSSSLTRPWPMRSFAKNVSRNGARRAGETGVDRAPGSAMARSLRRTDVRALPAGHARGRLSGSRFRGDATWHIER